VVGCGHWGRHWVRVLRDQGVLRAVVERGREGRARAQELAPGARVTPRLSTALRDPGVQAVVVASPAETHFELGAAALAAGRDVLVEKPLATDLGRARQLVRLAEEGGRVLAVGHLLEYHPAIVRLAELVRSGALGRVYYVISNRLNLGKIRSEENALWSFAPHDVAVILRLLGGTPVQVSATGGSYIQANIADATVTQMLFEDGARAHVFVSWLHPFKEQRLVVIGSEKMASYDDVSKQLVLYDRRVDWHRGQPVPTRGEGTPVAFGSAEPLELEARHFLHCVATRSRPLTDGESGVAVLRVLAAAQRSMIMNGEPLPLGEEDAPRAPALRRRPAAGERPAAWSLPG